MNLQHRLSFVVDIEAEPVDLDQARARFLLSYARSTDIPAVQGINDTTLRGEYRPVHLADLNDAVIVPVAVACGPPCQFCTGQI